MHFLFFTSPISYSLGATPASYQLPCLSGTGSFWWAHVNKHPIPNSLNLQPPRPFFPLNSFFDAPCGNVSGSRFSSKIHLPHTSTTRVNLYTPIRFPTSPPLVMGLIWIYQAPNPFACVDCSLRLPRVGPLPRIA